MHEAAARTGRQDGSFRDRASWLLRTGWPAVIGLASVSSAEIEAGEQVPESLYRFFADEVFAALDAEIQRA